MKRRAIIYTRLAPSVTALDSVASAVARYVAINIIGSDEMFRISQRDEKELGWWEKLQALAQEVDANMYGERF